MASTERHSSILVAAVILSVVLPTAIAQRVFSPPAHVLTPTEIEELEDEEFETPRSLEPPLGESGA